MLTINCAPMLRAQAEKRCTYFRTHWELSERRLLEKCVDNIVFW
jgi:hypothetical protein